MPSERNAVATRWVSNATLSVEHAPAMTPTTFPSTRAVSVIGTASGGADPREAGRGSGSQSFAGYSRWTAARSHSVTSPPEGRALATPVWFEVWAALAGDAVCTTVR